MPTEPLNYLHDHPDFPELIRILADEMNVDPSLIEKDYWIMQSLYGLQQQNFSFHLKGGTSLSKGYGLIHRFSEDIDIRIEPPTDLNVSSGKNHSKPKHIESRKHFYQWLSDSISIDGICNVERDCAYDDLPQYRGAGIRLSYDSPFQIVQGIKDGILLEVGFDNVTPYNPVTISSWAYERAKNISVAVIDNRAIDISCYHCGYTFVEKLQVISTKFRHQQASGQLPTNFIRHYYDVYCLLKSSEVQKFIGTAEYKAHKAARFPKADNQTISENDAFILSNPTTRELYEKEYVRTESLYYQGQPDFNDIIASITYHIDKL